MPDLLLTLPGWVPLAVLVGGVVMLLFEAFVVPGFGITGVLGIAAVIAGALLGFVGAAPTTGDLMGFLNVILASAAVVGALGWYVYRRLPAERRGQRVLLDTEMTRERGYLSAPRNEALVGAEGVALTDLRPAGTGRFGDDNVDVVSEGPWITAGTPIRIVQVEGYRHVVRPASAAPLPSSGTDHG
jgi:membrane-bound serine protease (ClpP class)